MTERVLKIEAFRNIGFNDKTPYAEKFILNHSIEKGKMGALVEIIGANNSGKSNVLQAVGLMAGPSKKELLYKADNEPPEPEFILKDSDVTDLLSNGYTGNPSVSLVYKDNKNKTSYSYIKTYNSKDTVSFPNNLKFNYAHSTSEYGRCSKHYYKEAENESTKKTAGKITIIPEPLTTLEDINKRFSDIYGYNFMPKVSRYEDERISNKDLNINDFSETKGFNSFFKRLFKAIDFDTALIRKAYSEYKNQNDRGILRKIDDDIRKIEDSVNQELTLVSNKFNKMFLLKESDCPYQFKIYLDRDGIGLSLFRGSNNISLEKQSEGFRWFFDLFFNLLCSIELNSGDIIIMDEPATHLHVKGQRELRAFLREFAIQNDITILIATHSPFLIDLDYLDELRIVVNDGEVSHIENNFSAVDPSDPDSLLPIKEALTVENYILVKPSEKVVFVEGITDYNYLTAFKKILGKQGISFLPINGLGRNEQECIKISQRLMKIRKDAVILVDGDEAGQRMRELNKDSDFTILSLGDITPEFKTIESLFTHDDLENFGLLDENGKFVKHASTSSVFKNQILKSKDSISEVTKGNFEKLFAKFDEELN